MAAFSYQIQHHPFLLDSVFLPNNAGMVMEEGNFMNNNFFSPKFPLPQEINDNNINPLEYCRVFESSCVDQSSAKIAVSDNELSSATKNQSTVSSTMMDNNKLVESGEQVAHSTVTQMDRKRKNRNNCSSSNSAQSKDPREVKNKKQKKCKDGEKAVEEKNPKAEKKNRKKVPEEPPKDCIHVRARRGQATDSHSLAERVRREKISVRMKILQKLVPGCDKVIGKALVLDEIINYVQSLQNQVEFLSMKLASVNPMFYEFGMEQDAFMVRPDDQRLNAASEPLLQSVPRCSPTQLTAFADTTTATTTVATSTAGFGPTDHNCYPILGSTTASLLLQQGQRPNDFSQDNGSLLWDVEEQKQKFLNPFEFTTNLCSFH